MEEDRILDGRKVEDFYRSSPALCWGWAFAVQLGAAYE
jgi:hypothetical protein